MGDATTWLLADIDPTAMLVAIGGPACVGLGAAIMWLWAQVRIRHADAISEARVRRTDAISEWEKLYNRGEANNASLVKRIDDAQAACAIQVRSLTEENTTLRESLAGLRVKLEFLPCRDCQFNPIRPSS